MPQLKSNNSFVLEVFLVLVFLSLLNLSKAQTTYYAYQSDMGQDILVKVIIPINCQTYCVMSRVGPTRKWDSRLTMTKTGQMYGIAGNLYKIDTLTGNSTLAMSLHGLGFLKGLVTLDGNIFYTMEGPDANYAEFLIQLDVAANTITNLGPLFPKACGDMCILDGEIYYPSAQDMPFFLHHIAKVNMANPYHNENVATVPPWWGLIGLSATNICNTLLAVDTIKTDELVLVNIKDGSISPMCEGADGFAGLTSRQEWKPTTICSQIDLDCDDSMQAPGLDFNGKPFDCLSQHVRIADDDVQMYTDTVIREIRIHLTGFVPDGPLEYVECTNSNAAIQIVGNGTHLITLKNGGSASVYEFSSLVERIYYNNVSNYPTGGMRTIEVEFTTELGTISEVATAFIPVIELPKYPIDLGDDIIVCGNEDVALDSGSPEAFHLWSTGSYSQTIYPTQYGQYSVYVFGFDKCPNWDTVDVEFLSQIDVSMEGDNYICGDEEAFVHLDISYGLPVDIEITGSDSSVMLLQDLSGPYNFSVPVDSFITYTITGITTETLACIELGDSVLTIQHFPSYEIYKKDTICDGDSILIGYNYAKVAGIYDNSFYTEEGCDSAVSVTLTVLPLPHAYKQTTSCDSSQVGVHIQRLPSAIGCDTILETTVHYAASDTTMVSQGTCRIADVSVFDNHYFNQLGCDSLVITTQYYIPPADTTQVFETSCDVNALGTFLSMWSDATGCDSIVATTVTMAPSDTTYLFSSSCIPSQIGTFHSLLTNNDGCDSLIISTVSFSMSDTTYQSATSCDPSSLGVFENHFTGQDGCDSTVFTTVTYSAHDSISLNSATCDPSVAGVFVHTFVNQFGCDSIITETISLSPSNNVNISGTTCDPSSTGVFIHNLTNHFGCDSVVTETITLLPPSHTSLSSTTCRSSDAGVFVNTYTAHNGCDSIVTLTVALVPADTTTFLFNTCDPAQAGEIENTFTNQDGCDSLVITTTTLFPLPQLNIGVTSDFNGFDISCFGENDGSVIANVSGVSPLTYLWSIGSPNQTITGLTAGTYAVTVTDANGCITNSSVALFEPQPFSITYNLSEPDCFNQHSGMISIINSGGVAPVRYSIDGINFQATTVFNNLSGGVYDVTAVDANGCSDKEIAGMNSILDVDVELGENQVVDVGDTVHLNALINVPFDSLVTIQWTNLTDATCPTCLTQTIIASVTTHYTVSITTIDGCEDSDEVTIFIGKKTDFIVPNIFSPNEDGMNDILLISGGPDVEEIASFAVYDRWGNEIYAANHFPPNDPAYAWDGTMNGDALNSGVFVYKLIAQFKGGGSAVRTGDVTLVK